MKRKWLYIGVAAASVLEFIFERIWHVFLFMSLYQDPRFVLGESPQLVYSFLSQAAFALVVGFFYLHVPDQKRNLRSGMTIGSILGLLIGMYQLLSWMGMFAFSLSFVVMETMRTIILGIIAGASISIAELKTNPRIKISA